MIDDRDERDDAGIGTSDSGERPAGDAASRGGREGAAGDRWQAGGAGAPDASSDASSDVSAGAPDDARTIPRAPAGSPTRPTSGEVAPPFAGRYLLERELGRGGMAVVHLATDLATGNAVALKVIHPELGAAMGAQRFRQEIRIASSLQHPHILPVVDSGEVDGQLYFAMPVVTGRSLHARIEAEGELPVEEAVRIARELAGALAYAHERGVVHRDVKPENVLLQDGRALLADFGIARASADLRTTQTLTRTGMAIGTPAYMSPEQATADRDVDARSDQYSLACVLYEMLTGEAPFQARTTQAMIARHLLEPVPRIAVVRSTVPAQVEAAIVRAMAKVPADRFPTITAFAEALGTPETWTAAPAPVAPRAAGLAHAPAARGTPARARRVAVGVLALVAVVAAAVFAWRRFAGGASGAPAVMVAVAPFNPLRPEYALWQEGMVDLIARNLDGAGPLRTVAPAVAIRAWDRGRVDRRGARALAQRTEARYAVFGSLDAAPGNLVRLRVSLLDAQGDSLWEGEWKDVDVRPLADSATRFVLARLGERYAIGAVRASPLGATSVEALKAFLQGEQHYRRTEWVPATAAYTRAAALDTGFALPLRRMAWIRSFQREGADTVSRSLALAAGRLTNGLAPRDSLLVLADSLYFSLASVTAATADWGRVQRLFATVDEAVRRYPSDPESWFALAEAREHYGYGRLADVTDEEVYAAFARTVTLDPGFAPAYIHLIEYAFRLRGREEGRRYLQRYLALNPTDAEAESFRLVDRLTAPGAVTDARTDAALDALPSAVVTSAMLRLGRWPDSSHTALALVRALARRPASDPDHARDSALVASYLPLQLAYRGRLREAFETLANRRSRLFAELTLLGGVPADTAAAVFAGWLRDGAPQARLALPFWAARRDVASIARYQTLADSLLRAATEEQRATATFGVGVAPAYLALAKGDTTAALLRFAALSDTLCLACYVDRLWEARLRAAKGDLAEADRLLRQRLYTALTPAEVWIAAERSRVARRRGDGPTATRLERFVRDAWSDGDPEVQRWVVP